MSQISVLETTDAVAAATCGERAHDCGSYWCPFDRIACGKPLPCPDHPTLCEDCRDPDPSGLCAPCTQYREQHAARLAATPREIAPDHNATSPTVPA